MKNAVLFQVVGSGALCVIVLSFFPLRALMCPMAAAVMRTKIDDAPYSQISKIANSNLRLGSLADRSFGANAGWFGKRFHKILDPRIDVLLGVGEIVAHVRSFAGRWTLVDRSIFAYLYE